MKRILLFALAISYACYPAHDQTKTFLVKKPNGDVVPMTAPTKYTWSVDAHGNESDQTIPGAPTEQYFYMREGNNLIKVKLISNVADALKKEKEQKIAAQKQEN